MNKNRLHEIFTKKQFKIKTAYNIHPRLPSHSVPNPFPSRLYIRQKKKERRERRDVVELHWRRHRPCAHSYINQTATTTLRRSVVGRAKTFRRRGLAEPPRDTHANLGWLNFSPLCFGAETLQTCLCGYIYTLALRVYIHVEFWWLCVVRYGELIISYILQ